MSVTYFDGSQLPKAQMNYVAFIDIMGTQAHMTSNIATAANFIFKLHAAILDAWRDEKYQNVFVYPVMDGAYITSANKEDIEKIVVRIFSQIATLLINTNEPNYKFVIRGCIAYGEVIHGHHVPYSASKVFELDLSYKNAILLGSSMISAYLGEDRAAPFGVFIDDSAHENGFAPTWKWYNSNVLETEEEVKSKLPQAVLDYFDATNEPKRDKHKRLAKEYFQE